MNRSYESMYLRKERSRLAKNSSTVDASEATVVHPFRASTAAGDCDHGTPSLQDAERPSREEVAPARRVGRLADKIAQFENPKGSRNASSAASLKAVSFNDTVFEELDAPPAPAVAHEDPPPSPPRRPMFVSGRPASVSPEPRRRSPSPVTNATGAGAARARSPGSIRGALMDPAMLAGIDWERAFVCRQAKQGQGPPGRRKPLSDALRSLPLTAKGTKLNAVSVYITHMDTLPGTLAQSVTTLYLSNNSLADLRGVGQFENAKTVSFANNLIRYLHDLYPLRCLKHMDKLSLEGNVVVHMPYYRQFVLSLCPSLEFLDGVRVRPEEKQAASVHSRKGATVMEQLRTNELRTAVLRHLGASVTCHAELISTVRGRFSVLRGAHIGGAVVSEEDQDIECSHNLATMLRCLEGGGVFRWLQIGCDDSFGRTVQSIAYRIYLSTVRNMPLEVRANLHHNIDGLRMLWDKLLSEYLHKQQERCMQDIESCERVLSEVVRSGRRSGDSGHREAEHDSAPLSAINRLQLVGMNSDAPEYRLTYCGLGPHLLARPRVKVKATLRKPTDESSVDPKGSKDAIVEFEHAAVDVSCTSATPRRVRSQSPTTSEGSGTRGRVVVGKQYLEPRRSGSSKKSPARSTGRGRSQTPPLSRNRNSLSRSPPRVLHQTPLVWEELTEEERTVIHERENHVAPMDGGYVELSQRYDDILQRHLQSGSTSVRSSRSRSKSPHRSENMSKEGSAAVRQLYTQSPPRSGCSRVSVSIDDAGKGDDMPWSSYTARQSVTPRSAQRSTVVSSMRRSASSPLGMTPFNSDNSNDRSQRSGVSAPRDSSVQFSPATLPPQQHDPDSEASMKSHRGRVDSNEHLLSVLLWGADDPPGSSDESHYEKSSEPSADPKAEPFNPEQEEVLNFLASIKTSSLDGDSTDKNNRFSKRYSAALAMIKECEAVWNSAGLEKMMHSALRTAPLGPHPDVARGSWTKPLNIGSSPTVSGSQRKVSPKRTPGTPGAEGDSMRSLKSQFESTSRIFGKIYEDIMITYEAQQILRQNAEGMREQLQQRSQAATRLLVDVRQLLELERKELGPAKTWVQLSDSNSATLMEYLSTNEESRVNIDTCYSEIEDLTRKLNSTIEAKNQLNGSIDEVLAAAEGLQTDMVDNPEVTSAIRYSHVVGLAVKHFASKSYLGLLHLYFQQLRRRVRRQNRIRLFYRTKRDGRDQKYLRRTLSAWMEYTTRELRLTQAGNWVKRGITHRYLEFWRRKFNLEQKVSVGRALNWHLRKKHAMLFLLRHAADSRRGQRQRDRERLICEKFTKNCFFRSWKSYLNRLSLSAEDDFLLTRRAIEHSQRKVFLAWKVVILSEKEQFYYNKLIPCIHAIECNRLLSSLHSWQNVFKAAKHLRNRRYATGFGSLLKKIISCGIKQNASYVVRDYERLSKVRPAFQLLRDWAARESRYSRVYGVVCLRYRHRMCQNTFLAWNAALSESRRRKQDALMTEAMRIATDLENANVAMCHYFKILLRKSIVEWRRSAKQAKSFRLIAQAEEELKQATEAYDKLKVKQKTIGDTKGYTYLVPESTIIETKYSDISRRINKIKKNGWVLSLDLVSSDEDDTATSHMNSIARASTASVISDDSADWGTSDIADAATARLRYGEASVHNRASGLFSSTETLLNAGIAPVVVREYMHASHFEVRFRSVFRKLSRYAKASVHLRYCEQRVATLRAQAYVRRSFSQLLAIWSQASMRKIAVVKLYADNKQNSAMENFELKNALHEKKAELATLKQILEGARADLAEKQVAAQEITKRLEESQHRKNEEEILARKMQVEKQTIDNETRCIVAQYELLVAAPDSSVATTAPAAVEISALSHGSVDVFYTPEGSKFKLGEGSAVVGALSPEHVEHMVGMQKEKDELDEEIHALHLSYLSLQSKGDANEKMLLESKYTAEHLAEQCHDMVSALEAQLHDLQEERQVASSVLLNCSRELSENQAIMSRRLGNIEADMINLAKEEEGLQRRLEIGHSEERLLREDLEALWEEERDLDMFDNHQHASALAMDELHGVDQLSAAKAVLKPAEDHRDQAQMKSSNDFLEAIQALGSALENHVEEHNVCADKRTVADDVRDSVAKTTELINRQRVCELVELQQSGTSSARSVSFSKEVEGRTSLPKVPADNFIVEQQNNSYTSSMCSQSTTGSRPYQEGDDLDSEIAMIARRIRDRLMMPSSTARTTSSA